MAAAPSDGQSLLGGSDEQLDLLMVVAEECTSACTLLVQIVPTLPLGSPATESVHGLM